LKARKNPAFRRKAQEFANELSETLTRTISPVPIRCRFVTGKNEANLTFVPPADYPDRRYVELANGCWVNVHQRLVPNTRDPKIVSTAKYSYSYSLSSDFDNGWLVRYDYEPEEEDNPDYPYPISHVHVNGANESYSEFMQGRGERKVLPDVHLPTKRISLEDFIRHLIVEFRVPLLEGKTEEEVWEILDEGGERFKLNRTK
jgi:Family of unknown function (DUF6516)